MIPCVPDLPAAPTPGIAGGLCGACAHVRAVRSGRGSLFLLCERGLRKEPGFAKYPRLPVVRCGGYEPQNERGPRDARPSP